MHNIYYNKDLLLSTSPMLHLIKATNTEVSMTKAQCFALRISKTSSNKRPTSRNQKPTITLSSGEHNNSAAAQEREA